MKKIYAIIITLFILSLLTSYTYAIDMKYYIDPNFEKKTVDIKLTLSDLPSKIYLLRHERMFDIEFEIIAIVNQNNSELKYRKEESVRPPFTRYRINRGLFTKEITIHYRLQPNKIIECGYIGDNFAAFDGSELFMFPDSEEHYYGELEITFSTPSEKTFVPLPQENGIYMPNRILTNLPNAENYDKIRNIYRSAYAFGEFDLLSKYIGNTNVEVVVPKEWDKQKQEEFAERVYSTYEYNIELFGGDIEKKYITTNSYMVICTPKVGRPTGAGEYSFGQATSSYEDGWYTTLFHAMNHRWNGWIWGFGDGELADFIREGTNLYYESKYLAKHLGYIKGGLSTVTVPFSIKYYYDKYLQNSWYSTPFNKHHPNRDDLEYAALLCFALDIKIMEDTDGAKSLDDFMKVLYDRYKLRSGEITKKNILSTLKESTGKDYAKFFNDYVYGTKKLNLDKYLIDNDGYDITPFIYLFRDDITEELFSNMESNINDKQSSYESVIIIGAPEKIKNSKLLDNKIGEYVKQIYYKKSEDISNINDLKDYDIVLWFNNDMSSHKFREIYKDDFINTDFYYHSFKPFSWIGFNTNNQHLVYMNYPTVDRLYNKLNDFGPEVLLEFVTMGFL